MAACSLFEDDEVYVYKPDKGYTFGIVIENSEYISSGEEDEGDAENERSQKGNSAYKRLQKGTIRVSWQPVGKLTVVPEDKVQLLDRSLMPGDVVRRLIPGQESQSGFVMDMDVRCHIRLLPHKKYIYNVNSKDLKKLQKFEYGQEVMLDSWLGTVESYDLQLILAFSDGARCQADENDICSFRDVMEKGIKGDLGVYRFYPGQELRGKLNCLNNAKWLHSTSHFNQKMASKKGKSTTVNVKVEKVICNNVEVHWLSRGFEKGDNVNDSFNPPPNFIEGEDAERLNVLDWFSYCSVEIGDQVSYVIKNDDIVSSMEPAKVYDPITAVIKDAEMKKNGDMKVQDDQVTQGASGTSLERDLDNGDDDADFEDIDDTDKSDPNDKNSGRGAASGRGGRKRNKVVKNLGQKFKPVKAPQKQDRQQSSKELQLKPDDEVQAKIELTTSWATVMWQDGRVERDIPSVDLFPVHHLDDLEFFPGDFVQSTVDLPEKPDYGVVLKTDHAERTCLIKWMKAYEVGKASSPIVVTNGCEVSVYDITDHPDYKFRPGQTIVRVGGFEHLSIDVDGKPQAVGQIFEIDPEGHLMVKWANGTLSHCYPQEVFILSDVDDVSDNNSLESWASESDYETDGSGETWETESENEIRDDSEERSSRDDSGFDQGALCEHRQELDTLLSRAETALVRLEKLLNVFDISTVSVPECFHDIIRIYRSCHDLDKILQSSFFIDPELQSLISQAKKELRHDKANKLSKHLSQLFEAWSNSLPSEDAENVGTVAFAGKTIRVGAQRKGTDIEVSLQMSKGERENCDISVSLVNPGAVGSSNNLENADNSVHILDSSVTSDLNEDNICDESNETKGIKESNDCSRSGKIERRSSDPLNISASLGTKSKKNKKDGNLVGENCVSKAAKRTKSDSFDDCGHEAKKSRDETIAANHVAQELCYKICQNLQKQILKIHEEVNKRTRRLLNVSVKQVNNDSQQVVNEDGAVSALAKNNMSETEECGHNVDFEATTALSEVDEKGRSRSCLPKAPSPISDSASSLLAKQHLENPNEKKASDCGTTPAGGDINTVGSVLSDIANECSSEAQPSESSVSQKEENTASLEDIKAMQVPCKGFDMFGEVQSFHTYVSRENVPTNPRLFRTAVKKELKLFQTSLPDGIFIKGFEDRLDLYSFMILGPTGTPYEDALFLFDMMLPNDYPNTPPLCHYQSYCTERLNPNLYEDGKVCVSLLGTWAGKGTEVWTSKSNLLQVLVSIQGLILVSEPYYNEAGYERQRGTQVGQENSRVYNEMAILKVVQSLTKICQNLPALFKNEIYNYLKVHGPRLIARLRYWMLVNEQQKKLSSSNLGTTSQNVGKVLQPQTTTSTISQPNNVKADLRIPDSTNGSIQMLPNGPSSIYAEENGAVVNHEQLTEQAPNAIHESSNIKTSEASLSHKPSEVIQDTSVVHSLSSQPHLESPGVEHSNKFAQMDGRVLKSEMSNDYKASQPVYELAMPAALNDGSSVNENLTNDLQGKDSLNIKSSQGKVQQGVRDITSAHSSQTYSLPDFTLYPMSRGFCLTLQKFLNLYEKALLRMEAPASQ